MQTSVEISMYPLGREYIPDITKFIENIRKYKSLTIEVNGMSTQIFGQLRDIMDALTVEMERSFSEHDKSAFVLKVINAHLQEKYP